MRRMLASLPVVMVLALHSGCMLRQQRTAGGAARVVVGKTTHATLEETTYHENGNVKSKCLFVWIEGDFVKHGREDVWYPDGQKQSECSYHLGKRHGKAVGWREWGDVAYRELWDMGIEVESFRFGSNGILCEQSMRGECGLNYVAHYREDGTIEEVNAGPTGGGGTRMLMMFGKEAKVGAVRVFPGSTGPEKLYVELHESGVPAAISTDSDVRRMYFSRNGKRKAESFPVCDKEKGYTAEQRWDGTFVDMEFWKFPFTFRRLLEYRNGELVSTKEIEDPFEEDSSSEEKGEEEGLEEPQ